MAGLLNYYFFPTDFYYPRPPPVNTTGQKQQLQEVGAVPAALQTPTKQEQVDDGDHDYQILENKEKPFNKLAIRCSNYMQDYNGKLVLKSSGAATSTFSTVYTLRKSDKDHIRAVMFEDYGF